MLTRRTVITAIRETTYGTDPAMTGANGLLAWDIAFEPKGETLKREVLRDGLSQLPHVIGMKECSLTFKVEIKGAGMTGTVPTIPELGVILNGCSFNTGVYTGTTLVYSLVSQESQMNSLALRGYFDGNYHKMLGARGSVKFSVEAGKYGIAEVALQGLYNPVAADTIMDIASLPTTLPPICYNASFQIAGYSPVCSKAEIDLANIIAKRADLNAAYGIKEFRITGREPSFSFDADAVVESSNPFWGDWEGNVVDTFGIQIGTSAGFICKLTGIFQYEQPSYGDQDGVRKYDCKAKLVSSNPNTQNDELTITFV